jgi:sugar phosphate isomerase/epimerase
MPLAAFPKCFLDQLCVTGEMTVDRWIDLSAELDIDGLEFYWGFTPWEDPSEIARLRARVADRGRSIPMMCYSSDFTRPEAAARAEEVEKQKQAVRTTAQLGGQFCRVLSGQRRPEVERAEGVRWVADCVHEVLPVAAEEGVTLILENHYKDGYWEYPEFAQRMDVFLELLDAIGEHPNFGVNYDPSNTIIAGEDPIAMLEAVKHRVVSMHASDRFLEGGTLDDLRRIEAHPHAGYANVLRHGVIGQGLNDYDRIFSILREVGFRGWISIEDGQDPAVGMKHLAESAAFLRGKMREYGLE